jgi:hypothetical protein
MIKSNQLKSEVICLSTIYLQQKSNITIFSNNNAEFCPLDLIRCLWIPPLLVADKFYSDFQSQNISQLFSSTT